jgi:hypothetical protein
VDESSRAITLTALTRRALFFGIGTTAASKALGHESLTVGPTNDNGFVVRIDFREVWRVTGAEIREAWGDGYSVYFPVTATVTITGRLLAREATLEFRFYDISKCDLALKLQGLPHVSTSANLSFASEAPIFTAFISPGRWTVAAGLPPSTVSFDAELRIDRARWLRKIEADALLVTVDADEVAPAGCR